MRRTKREREAERFAEKIWSYVRDNQESLDSERHVEAIKSWLMAHTQSLDKKLREVREHLRRAKSEASNQFDREERGRRAASDAWDRMW